MKAITILTLVSQLLLLGGCNGDVSESINLKLPVNSFTTIPSPVQSLLPPTFENPIKDYTVGLVPPPVESQATKTHSSQSDHQHHHVQAPVHQHSTHYASGFIAPRETSKPIVQQRALNPTGAFRSTAHHHQTHYSTNLLQPQVYQPKTVVHQKYQRHNARQYHYHQQHHQPNTVGTDFVIRPSSSSSSSSSSSPLSLSLSSIQQHSHHSLHHPVQYYAPITQGAVHQYSGSARYASVPVRKVQTVAEHVHANVQQSSIASPHPQPPSGVRIIQTYPSVSYAATLPQHGSTLNLGNTKLEPELVYIISEVLGRHHF